MKFWFIQTIKTSSNIDFSIVLLFILYKSVNFNHFLLLWRDLNKVISIRAVYHSFLIVFELIHIFIHKTNKTFFIKFCLSVLVLIDKANITHLLHIILNVIFLLVMRICFIMFALIMTTFFELCFWSVSAICNLMTYRLRSLTYYMPFTLCNLRCATYVL